MDILERATAVLLQTELALKDLLGAAAERGDYPSIVLLAEWARTIHELTETRSPAQSVPNASTSNRPARTIAPFEGTTQALAPRTREKRYPIFSRLGDDLVMLAWSKREKKEYRHKASHSTLQSSARAMQERGAGGRVFTTDELLPVRDITDGTDVPNYKVYVAISLLKQTGTIEQHGRGGYSITRNADFLNAVERIWDALPRMK